MKTVPLGELTDVLSGFAFKSSGFGDDGDMPVIRIRDVVRGRSETFYTGDYDPKFIIQNGETLIGMDGEFNCARWRGGDALLNQRVCRIEPTTSRLDANYLFRFLPRALKAIERDTPFVTVKHLSAKKIRAIAIPLPPIEEQRRIAAVLDAADDLRTKRRQALAKLDTLTQAIFIDMFGDPVLNEKGWERSCLDEACERIQIGPFGSLLHKADYVSDGVPIVNPMHIIEGTIVPDERTVAKDKHAALKSYWLRTNDVVMGRRGEMGRCAIVTPESDRFLCGSGSLFIRVDPQKLTPTYLAAVLSGARGRAALEREAQGVTMPNLNSDIVGRFELGLPPIDLQHKFNDRRRSTAMRQIQAEQSLLSLDTLFASLQQRAFAGEL